MGSADRFSCHDNSGESSMESKGPEGGPGGVFPRCCPRRLLNGLSDGLTPTPYFKKRDKSEIGHDFSRPRHPHRSECSALRSVRIGITTRDPSILQSSLPRSVRIGITTRDQSSNPGLIVRSVRSKQVTSRSVQICSDLKSTCEINPIP